MFMLVPFFVLFVNTFFSVGSVSVLPCCFVSIKIVGCFSPEIILIVVVLIRIFRGANKKKRMTYQREKGV